MELKAFEKWYAREVGDIGDCDPEEIKFFAKSAYFAGLNTPSPSADKLIAAAIGLLTVAKCPNCDGSGATMRATIGSGGFMCGADEYVTEQCQWCDERKQALAAYQKEQEI